LRFLPHLCGALLLGEGGLTKASILTLYIEEEGVVEGERKGGQ